MACRDAKSGRVIVYLLVLVLGGVGAYQLFCSAKQALEEAKHNAETRIERALGKTS